VRLIELTPEI